MTPFWKTKKENKENKASSKKDDKVRVAKSAKKDVKDKQAEKKEEKKQSMKDLYKKESKDKEKKQQKSERKYGLAYRVLLRPLITEKASIMGTENKYFFEVSRDANKVEIAKAIEEVYGVKPVSVNIINMKGKKVRFGRILGKRKDWKKAIVTLPEGKTIKIYEGV